MTSLSHNTPTSAYGLWKSPISAGLVSQKMRLEDVQWDSDGKTLVWLEGRSNHGVLVSQPLENASKDLTIEQNVRGSVGYGGGEFAIANGLLVFACRDGRLYRRWSGFDQPQPITPLYGNSAAPAISPDGRWIIYVFSDGKDDLIGMVDSNGNDWPRKLASGADFYMQPVWHPSGEKIAWVEWDHPNMPWDSSRLRLGQINGPIPHLTEKFLIAGDSHTAVCQPQFSPDGRWLSYISSNGDWESLILINMQNMEKQELVKGDGFHLTTPAWIQGIHTYGWNHTSSHLYYSRFESGKASLWVVDLESGCNSPIDISPYTWISQISVSPVAEELAFIATATSIPDRIVRWDGSHIHTVRRSDAEMVDPAYFPDPQHICWQSSDGAKVYGLFFPPCNPSYKNHGLPPAIINIHGGPTSQRTYSYQAETAYFTSRGYGWLDVNYRGSSGYGRSYQEMLKHRWGEIDVEDAVGGSKALVHLKLADEKRLVIKGGSAGGFTVLNALIRYPGIFKAGISLYGVSNLFTLSQDTHKFEAYYNDFLIGPLPEAAERFHALSPVFHASQIRDALAIFQGSDDKVVPPSQSEDIVASLHHHGIDCLYKLYEGEGHGFRKQETISNYLQTLEQFLLQHVIFAA